MLLKNSIQCKKCRQIITSKHRHDFVMCKCNTVGIDGGLSYSKITGNSDDYINKSIYSEKFEDMRKYLKWGKNYDKNMKLLDKTIWKPICKLDTDHIKAIIKNVKTLDESYLKLFKQELKYRKNEK